MLPRHNAQSMVYQPSTQTRVLRAIDGFPRSHCVKGRHARQPNDVHAAGFVEGGVKGVHHVGFLCEDLKQSLHFYVDILGLKERSDRPDEKLPYGGAWLDIGSEMIHLMELPNPDKGVERPEHGGRDRHVCIGVSEGAIAVLAAKLDTEGIQFTQSKSGRAAVFFRDPDENCLEVVEIADWR